MFLAKYRLAFFFAIIIIVLAGTLMAITFTKGYRLDFTTKTLKPNGILLANSDPAGAKVLIDGELKAVTNNTVNLPPEQYQVEIKKEGFITWAKKMLIEKELVTEANAFLFPSIPDIKPLTFFGSQNPKVSPDDSKIVYFVPNTATTSADLKTGLWVIELNGYIFNVNREPQQIVASTKHLDFAKANLFWSPDSRQVLAVFESLKEAYLLNAGQLNPPTSLVNAFTSLTAIFDNWGKEKQIRQNAKAKKLPPALAEILKANADNLTFSFDGTKVFYTATASAEIPEKLIPPINAASSQKEDRQIKPNRIYVYDIKEDRNFLIPFNPPKPTPTPKKKQFTGYSLQQTVNSVQWFATSRHLFWIEEDKVIACEYDGTNLATIYSGPFVKPFVFTSPEANRLIILSKIDSDPKSPFNLFAVSLR